MSAFILYLIKWIHVVAVIKVYFYSWFYYKKCHRKGGSWSFHNALFCFSWGDEGYEIDDDDDGHESDNDGEVDQDGENDLS